MCGKADFFNRSTYHNANLGTILLLKDKYRPTLDIARDSVKQISLEMALDFATIRRRVGAQGFSVQDGSDAFEQIGYSYPAMEQYGMILDRRADLTKDMTVSTNRGTYAIRRLPEALQEHKDLTLREAPVLSVQRWSWHMPSNHHYFRMAYLQKHFTLRAVFDPTAANSIHILEREAGNPEDDWRMFPPGFFLPSLQNDASYLTKKSYSDRHACNADHRFSQFFMKNAELLRTYTPGIYRELLHCLAENDENELIENVNELLARVRDLPNDRITVPDDVLLTKADLC